MPNQHAASRVIEGACWWQDSPETGEEELVPIPPWHALTVKERDRIEKEREDEEDRQIAELDRMLFYSKPGDGTADPD